MAYLIKRGGLVGLPLFCWGAKLTVMRRCSPTRALPVWLVFLVAALSTLPGAVQAQTHDIPGSREQVQLAYASLVKQFAPAVVNIFTRKEVTDRAPSPLFSDPMFRRFFGEDFLPSGQSRARMESSPGSGGIVRPHRVVVTNNHVIVSTTRKIVALTDRQEFEAEVVLADERTDLAVLKIEVGDEKLPVAART
jgi:S1-C subfamily serine protease